VVNLLTVYNPSTVSVQVSPPPETQADADLLAMHVGDNPPLLPLHVQEIGLPATGKAGDEGEGEPIEQNVLEP
jgi:hypothetical protein